MVKQQHGEDGMNAIADIVAKAFIEIKEDMDRIVNSGDVQSPASTLSAHAAGTSEEQLPAVQLGHGRTFSELPGYDDIELPDLEYWMPEALQSVESPSLGSPVAAPAGSSAAEAYGISVRRTYATDATGSREPSFNLRQQQQHPGSQGSPVALAACSPCSEFEVDSLASAEVDRENTANTQGATAQANNTQVDKFSAASSFSPSSGATAGLPASDKWLQDAAAAAAVDAAHAQPVATSHLTYTELLERAIAGMDPKLQQMSNNLLTRTSSRTSVEHRRASGESVSRRSSGSSSGGGGSAARPSSCGRAAARPASAGAVLYDGSFGQQTPGLMSVRPWQAQSKFPASSAGAARGSPVRCSSARAAAQEDGNGSSVRIFKQGSGSAMKLLGEGDERGVSGGSTDAGQRGASVRCSMDSQVSACGGVACSGSFVCY
jgi:hypothetical protein